MHSLKTVVKGALRRMGFELSRTKDEQPLPPDFDEATRKICRLVRPFTMTSPERIFALREAIKHVIRHEVQGDIVECGVWKGGSMMAAAMTLQELGATERKLFLFDTFDGMPAPGEEDVSVGGEQASDLLSKSDKQSSVVWAYSGIEEVRRNVLSTNYPGNRVYFVKGRVEDTIPQNAPPQVAVLRLDTDWYESTYHELVHLYPRLCPGGVLIIDDYGHWQGAKKAVDRYFEEQKLQLMLSRIDYTGRICIKK